MTNTTPDGTETSRLHFFISYHEADRSWAEWIGQQLEAAGYKVFLQAWDVGAGQNLVIELQVAIQRAERTLALLSPNYLQDEKGLAEWAAAFAQDSAGRQRKLIPIRVRPVPTGGLLGPILGIDLFEVTEAEARRRLLAGISRERARPRGPVAFPGAAGPKPTSDSRGPSFPGVDLPTLKAACALLSLQGNGGSTRGTGYLVAPNLLATCAHVVRDAGLNGLVQVCLATHALVGRVASWDLSADCALVEIPAPDVDDRPSVVPLGLASTCGRGDAWDAYGFPAITNHLGLLVQGDVQDSDGHSEHGASELVLYSRNVTAGALLQGFSGSPVLSGGKVIGHLKRVVAAMDDGATLGIVYACPARALARLLVELSNASPVR